MLVSAVAYASQKTARRRRDNGEEDEKEYAYTSMHVRALRSAPPCAWWCALRMVVYTSMHVRALRSAPPCAKRMVVYTVSYP